MLETIRASGRVVVFQIILQEVFRHGLDLSQKGLNDSHVAAFEDLDERTWGDPCGLTRGLHMDLDWGEKKLGIIFLVITVLHGSCSGKEDARPRCSFGFSRRLLLGEHVSQRNRVQLVIHGFSCLFPDRAGQTTPEFVATVWIFDTIT